MTWRSSEVIKAVQCVLDSCEKILTIPCNCRNMTREIFTRIRGLSCVPHTIARDIKGTVNDIISVRYLKAPYLAGVRSMIWVSVETSKSNMYLPKESTSPSISSAHLSLKSWPRIASRFSAGYAIRNKIILL